MKRRAFIRLSSLSGGITALGGMTWLLQSCSKDEMDMMGSYVSVMEGKFEWELAIPSSVQASNAALNAQVTTAQLIKGKTSRVFGYHNGLLGPTFRANSGENVKIQFQNQISETTNIHWHGFVIPANMDGHPADIVNPGGSFNYTFPIQQRAGTYWYHPHPHGSTASQVFKGLAGLFIVNDSEEALLNLPSGNYEIPLVIQDKRFHPDFSLNYSPKPSEVMSGYLGQYILINGKYAPYHKVASRWYRLRVLNGSTARVYNLALSNGNAFYVIGSDGGLLASPENVNSLLLAPGERADILVDFSTYAVGTEIFLQSNSFNGGVQGGQTFKMMKFIVDRQETDSFTVPSLLSVINEIAESTATKTRNFSIGSKMGSGGHGGHGSSGDMKGMHTINSKVFDMHRVDETVQSGDTEIWVFDNSAGDEIHPMHMHGVQFQVLDRTGGRGIKIASEKGWKDTVLCMPGEKVRVILKFPNHLGKFVFHCHNLEHEEDGMMLNFQIS
jgi:FtsP/CotA-like multicopper oxidase with cupredoxin domain